MKNAKTQKEQYTEIIGILTEAGRDDLAEFVQGRIDALAKKSEKKSLSKEQKANEVIKEQIVEILKDSDGMTVGEIYKANPAWADSFSSQKITSLLTQLIKADVVVRGVRDKKAVFSLVEDIAEGKDTDEVAEN